MSSFYKIIFSVLLFSIIGYQFYLVAEKSEKKQPDFEKLKSIWLHSQYNLDMGYGYFGIMTDEDLYTYAGMEYIRGRDPSTLNFEHPPLGKYILGLSQQVSGNIIHVQFLMSAAVLTLVLLIGLDLGIPLPFSLIPPLMLVFDPLFSDYSSYVHLDLIHLFFILLTILLVLKRDYLGKTFPLLAGLSLGAVMSSKAIFNGVVMFLFLLMLLAYERKKSKIKEVSIIISFCLLVYFLSYSVFFFYHGLSEFIVLHFKIVRFFRSYLPDYPWFEVWRILLLGKWRTWFMSPAIQPVSQFWILWPISLSVSGYFSIRKRLWRNLLLKEGILFLWAMIYLLYSSIHVVFPNYLLPVLPILYILAVYFIYMAIIKKEKNCNNGSL